MVEPTGFLLCIHSRTPAHGIVLPTFKASLPASANPSRCTFTCLPGDSQSSPDGREGELTRHHVNQDSSHLRKAHKQEQANFSASSTLREIQESGCSSCVNLTPSTEPGLLWKPSFQVPVLGFTSKIGVQIEGHFSMHSLASMHYAHELEAWVWVAWMRTPQNRSRKRQKSLRSLPKVLGWPSMGTMSLSIKPTSSTHLCQDGRQ